MTSKIDSIFRDSSSLGTTDINAVEQINSIPAVFNLISKMGDNLVQELGGRQIWSKYDGDLSRCHQFIHLVEVNNCGTTAEALLAAIYGGDISSRIMRLLYNFNSSYIYPTNSSYFGEIAPSIIEKEQSIKKEPFSFCTHTMALLKNNSKNPTPDMQLASSHVFVVIQYAEKGEVYYRILQSCLEEFNLKEDMNKPSNFMKTKNFEVFINGFIKFFQLSNWTKELEDIFVEYFHVKSRLECDKPNPYFGAYPFVYSRRSDCKEVNQNYLLFEEVKKTQIFQKIMSNVIL